jgi:hypothetical protein
MSAIIGWGYVVSGWIFAYYIYRRYWPAGGTLDREEAAALLLFLAIPCTIAWPFYVVWLILGGNKHHAGNCAYVLARAALSAGAKIKNGS